MKPVPMKARSRNTVRSGNFSTNFGKDQTVKEIKGSVNKVDIPYNQCMVNLYDLSTMALVSTCTPDESGKYSFIGFNSDTKYLILALDAKRIYNAVVQDRITPTILGRVTAFNAPYDLTVTYEDSSLVSRWELTSDVDRIHYYCSETPIDPVALPEPKAILKSSDRTYIDNDLILGKTYYVCVGSVRNSVEKISYEKVVLFGEAWTPANLANPSKLWLSAEDVVVDGSKRISKATDLSGNNYHFTQTTDSLKPLLVVDTILNRPVFKFDGINDYMNNRDVNTISKNISHLWSLAIHKKDEDVIGTNTILRYVVGTSPHNAGRFAHYASTGGLSMVGLGTRRLDSDPISGHYDTVGKGTAWVISLAYQNYSQASALVTVDGDEYPLSPAGTTGLTSNTSPAGAYAWLGTERAEVGFLKGCIAEVISGNTALTQSDIDKLFGWAAHKYGLTDNLPVDHPYKILVPTI